MSWLDHKVKDYLPEAFYTDGKFGIEIEIEGKKLPKQLDDWRVERDTSLKGLGDNYEYVIKSPRSLEEVKSCVATLYNAIRENQGSVDESMRAGIHVHVNFQDKTIKQLFTFMALYWILEDIIVPMFGENRVGNLFCLRMTDAEFINLTVERVLHNKDFLYFDKGNQYKYGAMNTECLIRYGSLEFRAMQTPTNPEPIYRWLDLLQDLLAFSDTIENPIELLGMISAGDIDAFIKSISDDLFELATATGNYEEVIYNSIRNIQFWVYSTNWA